MSAAPILVLAFGNPGRGDDALGPMLADRLEDWLAAQGRDDVEVIVDFQLNIEHALDLADRQRVLFVDARASGESGARLDAVSARADASYSTHAVSPQGLLAVHEQVIGETPPQAELLSLRGHSFELGDPLTVAARQALEAGWNGLLGWLDAATCRHEAAHLSSVGQ